MKIQIEIDDSLLRSAVEQQVSIVLAKFTAEALDRMAEDVISKKLNRFDPVTAADRSVSKVVSEKLEQAMNNALGQNWHRSENIRRLLTDAISAKIKESMK